MFSYDTMVDAINGLRERGFSIDFNIAFDKLICNDNKHILQPKDFEITEMYRFEGDSDPGDENVVYGIQSKHGSLMGIITSAYGLYAEAASTEMLKKLTMHADG